ncbi:MAG: hypothetical protein DWQ06_16185 [Calditrichaeota bacterium]|nr:MAG: hypothetical protein DWQ06_16185 [Calditrichota bacterium]
MFSLCKGLLFFYIAKLFKPIGVFSTLKIKLIFLVILLTFSLQTLQAQIFSSSKKDEQRDEQDSSSKFSLKNIPSIPFEINKNALEEPINPNKYYLGPGDQLVLSVWGEIDKNLPLAVSPDGFLVIPTVGRISVRDLTLAEATQKVIQEAKQKYINAEVTLTLTNLREIRVTISGMVIAPGIYTATQAMRVSDLIPMSGGLQTKDNLTVEEIEFMTKLRKPIRESSLRNITVQHLDGTFERVDLEKFYSTKNSELNPYLRGGDIVFIPQREIEKNSLSIFGAVKLERNNVEFIEGDKLGDLINFAHGVTSDASNLNLELVRFKNQNEPEIIEISLANLDFKLKPDDRVYVRKKENFHEKYQVWVTGEVRFPGVYSIVEGKTTITEIMNKAGGITKDASLAQTTLIRTQVEQISDPEFERLKLIPVVDMTETEREYFKSKSREINGAVVVDFTNKDTYETKESVFLTDKDILDVAQKRNTIRVTGQVSSPGLVAFESNKGYKYFIEKAGGYTENARKGRTKVIRASSGVWLDADEVEKLEEGDTIFIPEKPERDYYAIFKESLIITGQVLAIVVSTIVIYNQSK